VSIGIDIDLSKVVIFANSDITQSGIDAQDYCLRRGIPTANIVSFNFGTSNSTDSALLSTTVVAQASGLSGYVGLTHAAAATRAIAVTGATAILSSTLTPFKMDGLDTVPGHAGGGSSPFISGVSFSNDDPGGQMSQYPPVGLWAYPRTTVPHGRLGCPATRFGYIDTIAEQSLASNASATVISSGGTGLTVSTLYDNCVASAIAAEQVDHRLHQHVISSSINRVAGAQPLWESAHMTEWARAIGLTVYDLPATYSNGAPDYNASNTQVFMGTISPPLSAFALVLGELSANDLGFADRYPPAAWEGNFSVLPGAWMYIYTSFTDAAARGWLHSGAAAAHMTAVEPTTAGLPRMADVFRIAVLHKAPLCVASWLASGANRATGRGSTVCGDPLYRPYKSTSLGVNYIALEGDL
jgi:hypothetical protein